MRKSRVSFVSGARSSRRARGPFAILLVAAALTLGLGCHRESEMVPFIDQKIAFTDRFFDVHAFGPERAIVVGYSGKILETEDGGLTWTRIESGTERNALFSITFPDAQNGWIVGQDGTILRSTDGGKTWASQRSGTDRYLFSIVALDKNRAWAVGDRSTIASTTDGGRTWRTRKLETGHEEAGGLSIAAADPVFYDVRFVDANTGWISGEFGKLLHTADGGNTWTPQHKSLMGDEFFDVLDLPTLFGLSMQSTTEGVAVGLDARIARTVDGGGTWSWQSVESPYPLLDPFFATHVFPDGSGWAIGAAGQVVRRKAGDEVWRLADLGQPVFTWLRGMSFFDETNGWMVGGYGTILRTTDGGKTWIPCFG